MPFSRSLAFSALAMVLVLLPWSMVRSAGPTTAKAPADWNQWRGPDRTGASTEANWSANWPKEGPRQAWKASVGQGFSAVAVSGNRAYTMGNKDKQDTVYCFNVADGAVVWKHSYPCAPGEYPGPRSTPTVDGKFVYTFSRDGHLICFDAAGGGNGTGKIVWAKHLTKDFKLNPPGWGFACSPLVVGDKLIVDAGTTLALNKATGEPVWKSPEYAVGYSSPVSFQWQGKPRVAVFNGYGPVVLNESDGTAACGVRWKTEYDVNAATPIVHGDKIFVSSGYDTGAAVFQIGEGHAEQVWKSKVMRNHFNSCVLVGDSLYGFDESTLKCVDFATGKERWAQKDLGKGSLTAADGKLIVLSDGGELIVAPADPAAFKPVARAKVLAGTCWTVPVLSGGKIFCRNADGDLVCLDVEKK